MPQTCSLHRIEGVSTCWDNHAYYWQDLAGQFNRGDPVRPYLDKHSDGEWQRKGWKPHMPTKGSIILAGITRPASCIGDLSDFFHVGRNHAKICSFLWTLPLLGDWSAWSSGTSLKSTCSRARSLGSTWDGNFGALNLNAISLDMIIILIIRWLSAGHPPAM